MNSDQAAAALREMYPNAKPGTTSSKAFVFWRNRSYEPNEAFSHIVTPRKRAIEEAVELGGYIIGKKNPVGPEPFVPLDSGLSAVNRLELEQFYKKNPTLLFTPPEGIALFDAKLKPVVERVGSAEKLLKDAQVTLELTEAKALALRRASGPDAAGKYIIAEDGRAFFVNEAELKSLAAALGEKGVNHGLLAALINRTSSKPIQAIIDYGGFSFKDGNVTTSSLQSHWNTLPERRLDSVAYLHNYR